MDSVISHRSTNLTLQHTWTLSQKETYSWSSSNIADLADNISVLQRKTIGHHDEQRSHEHWLRRWSIWLKVNAKKTIHYQWQYELIRLFKNGEHRVDSHWIVSNHSWSTLNHLENTVTLPIQAQYMRILRLKQRHKASISVFTGQTFDICASR